MVRIFDDHENFWQLRNFTAKILLRFQTDKFAIGRMTYMADFSKAPLIFLHRVCIQYLFLGGVRLTYKTSEAELDYLSYQFSSWYANKSGIVLKYSECCSLKHSINFCGTNV